MKPATTTLHTVNKSAQQSGILSSCLSIAAPGETVLLIEDGVYALVGCIASNNLLIDKHPDIALFALREDLQARGLEALVSTQVQIINYGEFVALTCRYSKTISWF